MHIDFVDESNSQSISSKVPKYQIDTLEELAVLELVANNPTIKQQKFVKKTGKFLSTVKK